MQFPTDEHESFIIIPHTFSANRVYAEDEHSRISAATITLKIACGPVETESMPLDERGKRAGIGFQRLRIWMDAILTNIVVIDVESALLDTFIDNIANSVMFIPGQPDDSRVSVVLHSKISAITKDLLEIHSVSLTATDTENIERNYRNLDPANKYPLPGIEYLKGTYYEKPMHDKPWWERPTVDVCEYTKEEDSEDGGAVLWFEDDPLAEIGKEYLTNGQEADIIVFDLWKNPDK